jgi:flagellar biosynthetic protein FliR
MVLTESQIMAWLGQFLWPFLRITGLFLTAPLYGSALIPNAVKAAMAAAFAAALAFWLPALPAFPGDPASAIFQGILQLTFGALLGMVMQVVVAAIAGAGEMVGLSIGLSFAELQFREASSATPVLYDIMFWAGLIGFMGCGGPVWLFAALAHSFANGVGFGDLASTGALLAFGGKIFTAAVALTMPVLAVSLCVNITIGLMAVFAPQLNILTIGFPLLILVGLWAFAGTLGYLDHDIRHLVGQATNVIGTVMPHG